MSEPRMVQIGELHFEAVPLEEARFDDRGAIHVVLDLDAEGEFVVLDVGEATEEGVASIDTPARQAAWRRDSKNQNLYVGTYLVPVETLLGKARSPSEQRAWIVQKLCKQYKIVAAGRIAVEGS